MKLIIVVVKTEYKRKTAIGKMAAGDGLLYRVRQIYRIWNAL
jgi:hypothetical protein